MSFPKLLKVRSGITAVAAIALGASCLVALPAQGAPISAGVVNTAFAPQDALNSAGTDWLHTNGNKIVDSSGKEVWLTGVNWFGFNATERVFHGLWSVSLVNTTKAMADRGINVVRVPVSTQLLLEWRAGQTIMPNVNAWANPELSGMNNLQVFDYWLNLCEQYGIKVILDVHSAEADNSGHVYNMWYKGNITTANALDAWEWVADRYKNNDTIIGADLKNEPHGGPGESPRAKWDSSTDQDNFKYYAERAAARILAKNPNMLILVEGIQISPKAGVNWSSTNFSDYDNYWWGGNLKGVAQHPINLGVHQDQLVYSPHDYGPLVSSQPWFTGNWNRQTLEANVWDPNWLFIHKQNKAPLLIGEWGGFLDNGPNQKWMNAMRDLIVENKLHHTFWALNPNSGDTGGLLKDDWISWDEAKYALVKPALWAHEGKFVSLDHEVKLGGENSTTGISLSQVPGSSSGGGTTDGGTTDGGTTDGGTTDGGTTDGGTTDGGTTDGGTTDGGTTDGGTTDGGTTDGGTTDGGTTDGGTTDGGTTDGGYALEPLRDAAKRSGRYIGYAYGEWNNSDVDYVRIAQREFNMLTAENSMKWDATEPSQGNFTFTKADQVAQFAKTNDQALYGHTLVWHSQLPSWVSSLNSAASLRPAMLNHISKVAGRYAGQVHSWDVVNEAFNDDGSRRTSVFQNVLGNGYIEEAFVAARAADPAAKLCINDYNTDGINAKSTAIYNLVKDFKQRGVPIDCVGFQSHLIVGQVPSSMQQNLQRFADLGVEVRITELDIRMNVPADSQKLATQAADYNKVFAACWAVSKCNGVTLWGITDKHSWIPGVFQGQGAALLWNDDYSVKPAFDSVAQVIGLQPTDGGTTDGGTTDGGTTDGGTTDGGTTDGGTTDGGTTDGGTTDGGTTDGGTTDGGTTDGGTTDGGTTDGGTTDGGTTDGGTTDGGTAPACAATYTTAGNWGSGFQGNINVTATKPVTSWTLSFTMPNATINNIWGAKATGTNTITVTNEAWNGTLSTGQTATVGFIGNGTAPTNLTITCN